ncbi:EpsG family protein [Enterococcus canintestini]|uniref:EpsG family protein n=1 Tax=Enterococcus canintestini TaxID=317010 RepID=A0A267HUH9_9ENTE|nr:EpsG family protein [Enterococcus canintestini]PAB01867.1 hypothetical protein AKL21_02745 [Enterococcus canintestini]
MESLMLYLTIFLVTLCILILEDLSYKYAFDNNNQNIKFYHRKFYINGILKKSIFFLLAFFPLIVLSGQRFFVGTDYGNYLAIYKQIGEMNLRELIDKSKYLEPLYVFFNKISYILSNGNEKAIFYSSALLIFLILYLTLLKMKEKFKISLTLGTYIFLFFFFPLTLNIIRQMIAIVFVLYAFLFLLEKKSLAFLTLIFFASGFHNSAIILFPLVALNFIRENKYKYLFFLILLSPMFVASVLELLPSINLFSRYLAKYSIQRNSISIFDVIEASFFLIPIFLNRKKILKVFPESKPLFLISLLIIPIVVVSSYQFWFSRMSYFIFILMIYFFPVIVKVQKDKKSKLLWEIFFLSYFFVYFILKFYIVGTEGIFPYSTLHFVI